MENYFDNFCTINWVQPNDDGNSYGFAAIFGGKYIVKGTIYPDNSIKLKSLIDWKTFEEIPITDDIENTFGIFASSRVIYEIKEYLKKFPNGDTSQFFNTQVDYDSYEDDEEYDSDEDDEEYYEKEYDGPIVEPNIKDLHVEGEPDMFAIYSGDTLIAECDIDSYYAVPFVLCDGKIYVGDRGGAHPSCNYPNDIRESENYAFGRIWLELEDVENGFYFPYSILVFWCESEEHIIDTKLVDKFLTDYGVDKNKVLVPLWEDIEGEETDCIMPYTEWNFKLARANERQKKARELHLMNAHDKYNATADFRTTRDRRIGQKLTNDKGVEMPVAQYRNMIYGENNKRFGRIIKEVINQYLKQNLVLN